MAFRRTLLCAVAALLLTTGVGHARPGAPDPRFAGAGSEPAFVSFLGEDYVHDLFVQRDRKIVVAGTTWSGLSIAVARLLPDGAPDKTFSGDGQLMLDPTRSGGYSPITVIATPGPSNSIFVVSSAVTSNGTALCCSGRTDVIKVKASGALDRSFGAGGRLTLEGAPAYDAIIQAALASSDGSLVLAGSTRRGYRSSRLERAAIIRLNKAGAIEPPPVNPITGPYLLGNSAMTSLASVPGGGFVAAGYVDVSNGAEAPNSAMMVTRVSKEGVPDATFGAGGTTLATFDEGAAHASDVLVQSNGSITVLGTATLANNNLSSPAVVLARFKGDGTPDAAFGGDGKAVALSRHAMGVSLALRGKNALSVSIQTARCSMVACNVTGADVIGIASSGKLDRSFGSNGFSPLSKLFLGNLRVATQGDRIIVAGTGLNEPEWSCPVGPCFRPRQGRPYDFAVDRLGG